MPLFFLQIDDFVIRCDHQPDDIHVYRSQDELQGLNKNTRVRVRSLQKAPKFINIKWLVRLDSSHSTTINIGIEKQPATRLIALNKTNFVDFNCHYFFFEIKNKFFTLGAIY